MKKIFLFLLAIFLTQCGDLAFSQHATGLLVPKEFEKKSNIDPNHLLKIKPKLGLPESFDWRTQISGGLTPVRDQGNCGSCAAFALVGLSQDVYKIVYSETKEYSPQYLVSCNKEGWGCDGSFFYNDYHTIGTGKGLESSVLESQFPYQAADVECKAGLQKADPLMSWKYIDSYVDGQYKIPSDDVIKQGIWEFGGVSAAVYVDSYLQSYKSGIHTTCFTGQPNHAIEIVGWGKDKASGVEYWIVKNSWSSSWGEQGYFRIQTGGCNMIGYGANVIQYAKKPSHGDTPTPDPDDDCDPEPTPDPDPPTPPTPPCTPEAKADAWPDHSKTPRDYGRGIILGSPAIAGTSYLWTNQYGKRIGNSARISMRVPFTSKFNLYAKTKCGEASDSVVVKGYYRDKPTKKHYFMPENNLYLFDNKENSFGISKEEFDSAIAEFEKVYTPIAQKLGFALSVVPEWDNPEVNAYTFQQNGVIYIHMFGGLARRTEITKDGFSYVLSHEMAHNIGGFPWDGRMAIEGQSDYGAGHAVMKTLWKGLDNSSYKAKAPKTVLDKCNAGYSCKTNEVALCARIALAGKSGADLLAALQNTTVSFDTPDKTVVDQTMEDHPPAQCRLDTLMNSAACNMTWNNEVIPQSESESLKYQCNNRPLCWFKPSITRL